MPPHATPVEGALLPAGISSDVIKAIKHKRRYCREEGCTNIVKSQGLCQRHGAKPRMCKVENCSKQAQGNFDGMCKSHFKALKRATVPLPPPPSKRVMTKPPSPEGLSVYDSIIPASIIWKPESGKPMPLVEHLARGFADPTKSPAWHRNEERTARGLWPVHNPATQLESWERELVWTEILLLTGNQESSFRHLARGWGRDKGFHTVLAQFICERRGNVERKKRRRESNTIENDEGDSDEASGDDLAADSIGVDVYDDAVYGDTAYNEALAADLFCFPAQRSPRLCMYGEEGVISTDGSDNHTHEFDDHMEGDHLTLNVITGVAHL